MMMRIMALKSAMLAPGSTGSHFSACSVEADLARVDHEDARPVARRLLELDADDRVRLGGVRADARGRRRPRPRSSIEFVIAPLPNAAARPATVELCQRRAQWSMLCVPMPARMSFWNR